MEWYVIAAVCLLSGALIGFTGGVLGIGGGLLAIPLLGLVAGMGQQEAQGTALIMVLPAVLMTVRKYNQNAKIDFRAAGAGAAGSIVFTWIGAQIALGIDPVLLRHIYAVFVLGIAVFYVYQGLRGTRPGAPAAPGRQAETFHKGWFALIGMVAGLAGGVFGVGGSVLVVPILTTVFRLTQTGAQALALTMIIPGTFVALFTYAAHGQANWLMGLPMALGSIVLVPYGVKLAYALPEPRLKLMFACMLLVIMVLLLMKA
ncbi:sulfite exporter TauE/SafE family protein [Pusillimonas sp. SM2304]|nr:sulfite exporter TauE/SafE family protein [Pusillimonas sp. SM2304]MDS1142083.1 sulfite exporter TauE/SafE family protein [Pusillimonas sp. SM2304]